MIAPERRTEPTLSPKPIPRASLVSTTLTGNSEAIIGDALRSVVDWVDRVLVVDTGVTDATLDVARAIAGDTLVVREFPWRDDFALARNFALEAAAELGGGWAVTLDTDERIDLAELDIRAALTQTTADTLRTEVVTGGRTHVKDRLFRLPARGRFVGPTHEYFVATGRVGHAAGIRVRELMKTPAALRQRAERDAPLLARYRAAHPDEPRWHGFLGKALARLGRDEEAVAAFRACADLSRCDEEAARALYAAAFSLTLLGRDEEALAACAAGMDRHAGVPELPWLASAVSWECGRPEQAAHFARLAVARGRYAGEAAPCSA